MAKVQASNNANSLRPSPTAATGADGDAAAARPRRRGDPGSYLRDANIELLGVLLEALARENDHLYHSLLVPITAYVMEMLPEGHRETTKLELRCGRHGEAGRHWNGEQDERVWAPANLCGSLLRRAVRCSSCTQRNRAALLLHWEQGRSPDFTMRSRSFEDLENLAPDDVTRIVEWLTEKVDALSTKLKPELKDEEVRPGGRWGAESRVGGCGWVVDSPN